MHGAVYGAPGIRCNIDARPCTLNNSGPVRSLVPRPLGNETNVYTPFRTAGIPGLWPPRSPDFLLLSRVMTSQTTEEDDDFEKLDMGSIDHQILTQ